MRTSAKPEPQWPAHLVRMSGGTAGASRRRSISAVTPAVAESGAPHHGVRRKNLALTDMPQLAEITHASGSEAFTGAC
jgi:hypothetical protein